MGLFIALGGISLLQQCQQLVAQQGNCPTGQAVITGAGNLPAKFVIHTVGPVWHGGQQNETELLQNCYLNSLQLAVVNGCKSIALPNISTGVYRFPKPLAAKIAVASISQFLTTNQSLEQVYLVCFDAENHQLIKKQLELPLEQ